MGMIAFHDLFPEIGVTETRVLSVFTPGGELPVDSYAFLEWFCVDPGCDCRRVMINVMAEQRRAHIATIGHAFEPPRPGSPGEVQTILDPLNPQSRWSPVLLRTFEHLLLSDEGYRDRIVSHYRMVKDALADPAHPIHGVVARSTISPTTRVPSAIDPYGPCPCGSGKKFKWCCRGK